MQWGTCLACSHLQYGYLVPRSVRWLISLSLSWLVCPPGHLILMWNEWNGNTGDVMVMWFTSYVNLVTSHWACMLHACMHACMHGACALSKNGMPKYPSGMTSSVFVLPEHHISWFTLHGDDLGMTSSCSHHICITLMMSSLQIMTSLQHA